MPVVRSPFSGLPNDRKLTDEDIIRAIRFAAAGEYEAAQTYIQLAESLDNKLAAKVLQCVADINREHMGDFLRLPYEHAMEEANLYAKGAIELEEGNQENALGFQGMLDNPTFS